MTEISIIIVHWRVPELLKNCLESVKKATKGLNVETIVIDNNSGPVTYNLLHSLPWVKTIINYHNLGFAKAVNQGLKAASGKYILILNPDAQLTGTSLTKMKSFLERHPEVGLVGPKMLYPDGSIQLSVRSFPTVGSQILVLLKLINLAAWLKPLRKYLRANFNYSETQAVDQLMGAALMLPRSVIDKVGTFDERFFVWFEEVDFCLRLKQADYQVMYLADALVIHQQGASFDQLPVVRKQQIFNRSLLAYFKKNIGWPATLALYPFIPINLALTVAWSLVKRR